MAEGAAPATAGGGGLSGLVVAFALIGSVCCAGVLLFVRFAHWAGTRPYTAGLLIALTVPVFYVLGRAMPRGRELRRAARAGMAAVDRDLAPVPAGAPVEVPAAPFGTEPVHDGLTVELAPQRPDFMDLDPDAFEAAVAALCERDGCRDVSVVGGAGDLGADVIAVAPDGRRVVVQCKRYAPDHKVGSQDLQRFGGTCWSVHGAQLPVVVTTSSFTAPAQEYAAGCGIHCVDGAVLRAWAEGSGSAPWGPAAPPESV
ncbi:restriction endonuclease [Streptomyces sp. VRA16 Mangrove soil]|uniref:restriction endonuclease n=1 Tax=Streptomyces sp. VRA16 Mangrove soil TaxID=2817434 RepID=UPI001A9EDA4D|nr:restriction endonuclease [Streptomyces sp. VRA16 Mangrove soil]MBO1330398.1 restriction endonuclease [Streptomyces sp. VRA16 Mangrove soil]